MPEFGIEAKRHSMLRLMFRVAPEVSVVLGAKLFYRKYLIYIYNTFAYFVQVVC